MPIDDRSRPVSYAWNVTAEADPDAFDRYYESMHDIYDVEDVDEADRAGFVSQTFGAVFDNGVVARGLSVPQTLRRCMTDMRLEGARSALSGRDPRRQTVAEVAYRHGFANAAHFTRLYRERFGHAPGEMAARRLESRVMADGSRSTFRHDLIVNWLRGRNPAMRARARSRILRSA